MSTNEIPLNCKMRVLFPILIIRSDHLEAILKAVFLVQRQKTVKPPYLKITFSTYVGNSQNTADATESRLTVHHVLASNVYSVHFHCYVYKCSQCMPLLCIHSVCRLCAQNLLLPGVCPHSQRCSNLNLYSWGESAIASSPQS